MKTVGGTILPPTFIERLSSKVREQIKANNVGFLLGAGSSYLEGNGYPLAFNLWDFIKEHIPDTQRADIQAKLDAEPIGIERALDLLDSGMHAEGPHRQSVVSAIATHFLTISANSGVHRRFIQAISLTGVRKVNIFSLNYDPLIERAAEIERAGLGISDRSISGNLAP